MVVVAAEGCVHRWDVKKSQETQFDSSRASSVDVIDSVQNTISRLCTRLFCWMRHEPGTRGCASPSAMLGGANSILLGRLSLDSFGFNSRTE